MMPSIPQIIECPRYGCEQKLVKRRLKSGNTFGATFWTDGRMDAPMMPEYPDFTRCPECGWFFWVHKAEELGPYIPRKRVSEEDPSKVEDYPSYPEVREPTFKQYIQALETKLGQWPNVEKELRLKAWRKYNDKYRPKPKKNEEFKAIEWTPESRENANNILMLLYERNIDNSISKAELLRELGRFGLAHQMLDIIDEYGLDEAGDYQASLSRIRELAGLGISDLAVIPSSEQESNTIRDASTKIKSPQIIEESSHEVIEKLLNYLPFFKKYDLKDLVTHYPPEKQKDGSTHFGYYNYHQGISDFFEILYEYNWHIEDYIDQIKWEQLEDQEWIEQANLNDLRLAFTFLARSEYWAEGSWKKALEKDFFRQLLERLHELNESS